MKTFHLVLVCVTLLGGAGAVLADTPLTYDRVQLSASASRDVENDTMTARLFTQEQGKNSRSLANAVNQTIAWAVAEAKKVDGVKVKTDAYSTSPVYHKSNITGWRVRQSIALESQDMAALSDLIGLLQERVKLEGIGFTVSRDKRKMVEDELIKEALSAFRQRADLIAGEMAHASYQLVTVNVNTSQPRMPYMARGMKMEAMAMSADMAAPVVEAGEATLSVSINGSIELR